MHKTILYTAVKISFIATLFLTVAACAQLSQPFQKPTVKLEGLRLDLSNFFKPSLDFDLLITNPNSYSLNIKSLQYDVSVLGVQILSGGNNNIDKIAAQGTLKLTLQADSDIPSLLSLANKFKNLAVGENIDYSALITIQPSGPFPRVEINKNDVIEFSGF